ncbi:MAG: OprO/OprP family phosphate-selective porin [Cyclobacteriaceae bacterium]|nr:OprO/OprP family phosphate-selective porin [Cyclobacteriaceae bacterium]
MKKITLVLSLFVVGIVSSIQAQNLSNNKFGKGIQVMAKDSSFYMKASIRFQTLYNGELNLVTDEWNDNVMIRRSRLKFNGFVYNPKVEYKIELAISNRDNGKVAAESNSAASIVLDAVLKYKFAPNWQLWFGQTKLPGNRERVISSQALQFVDRSQLNSKYTIDRGTGVQLRGKQKIGNFVVKEAGSVSMGEGRNFTKSNIGGYEFTGRIELLPFGEFSSKGDYFGSDLKREKSPKLAIGVTYDQNNSTTRENGFKGDFLSEARNQNTVFVDAMFKYKGFSTMFEYADKRTDESAVLLDGTSYQTGTGTNIQLGYLFKNNFEVAARYTDIKPENNNWSDDYSEMTLGFSRYIVGHSLKVQSDLTFVDHDIDNDIFRFRLQAELAF